MGASLQFCAGIFFGGLLTLLLLPFWSAATRAWKTLRRGSLLFLICVMATTFVYCSYFAYCYWAETTTTASPQPFAHLVAQIKIFQPLNSLKQFLSSPLFHALGAALLFRSGWKLCKIAGSTVASSPPEGSPGPTIATKTAGDADLLLALREVCEILKRPTTPINLSLPTTAYPSETTDSTSFRRLEQAVEELRQEMTSLSETLMQNVIGSLPTVSSVATAFANVEDHMTELKDIVVNSIPTRVMTTDVKPSELQLAEGRSSVFAITADEKPEPKRRDLSQTPEEHGETLNPLMEDNSAEDSDMDDFPSNEINPQSIAGMTYRKGIAELQKQWRLLRQARKNMPLTEEEKRMSRDQLLRVTEEQRRQALRGDPDSSALTEEEKSMPRAQVLAKLRQEERMRAAAKRQDDGMTAQRKWCYQCQKDVPEDHQCLQVAQWSTIQRRKGVPGKEAMVITQQGNRAARVHRQFHPMIDRLQKEHAQLADANQRLQAQLATHATPSPISVNQVTAIPPPPPPPSFGNSWQTAAPTMNGMWNNQGKQITAITGNSFLPLPAVPLFGAGSH